MPNINNGAEMSPISNEDEIFSPRFDNLDDSAADEDYSDLADFLPNPETTDGVVNAEKPKRGKKQKRGTKLEKKLLSFWVTKKINTLAQLPVECLLG